MIVTIILNILYFFAYGITTVISSFGDVTANNAISEGIALMAGYYISLDEYLPITTLVAIVAFDLVFELAVFVYKLVRWGYQKVPGVS